MGPRKPGSPPDSLKVNILELLEVTTMPPSQVLSLTTPTLPLDSLLSLNLHALEQCPQHRG